MDKNNVNDSYFYKMRNSVLKITNCGIVILLMMVTSISLAEPSRSWKSLADDKNHDPELPALKRLQEPREALLELPADSVGNQVSWVDALIDGYISPRTGLESDDKHEVLNMDLVFGKTGEMPLVLFPHRPHTEWLSCENCHSSIFKKKFGATPINMFAILAGEFCGRCHGGVAFPLTECHRCHSIPRNLFKGKLGRQPIHQATDTKLRHKVVGDRPVSKW